LQENGLPSTVLAALVAWAVTLAPAALARSAPRSAFIVALCALFAGVTGPLFARAFPPLARHIGISLFLVLATMTWLLASPTIQPFRLDPLRAAIGAVAWGVFALSWNERWTSTQKSEVDPFAPVLQARATLPRLAVPIAALGVAAGLAYLAIAWRVREVDRALLAHSLALVGAVAVVSSAATTAVSRDKRHMGGSRRFTLYALRPLILLIALAIGGAIVIALR
jgi:hypothetical protein